MCILQLLTIIEFLKQVKRILKLFFSFFELSRQKIDINKFII